MTQTFITFLWFVVLITKAFVKFLIPAIIPIHKIKYVFNMLVIANKILQVYSIHLLNKMNNFKGHKTTIFLKQQ